MDLAILEAYDARRDFSNKGFKSACYAPFVSMFFDTLGQVRVCCVNYSYTLGNVRSQRLDDIWNGAATKTLREAMAGYDFGLGCDHCKWQIQDGHPFPHATKYDLYPVPAEGEFWPRNMEFNLSNTCNLECVMCSGELSSAIRSRRDRYPPLARVYDDQFFLDLRKYLPHLVAMQCLGGEPFLIREQYRVWDMLIEDGLKPACQITTNGTQYNDKVERILNHLPVEITISMDGITKETLESLRINVRFDELMANFHRFHAYSKAHGRGVGFNFTLMRQNWHEFADFLLFAEQWGSNVNVCTLLHPAPYALYTLPTEEIRKVVEELERRDDEMCRSLVVNRKAWSDVLTRLQARVSHAGDKSLEFVPQGLSESFRDESGQLRTTLTPTSEVASELATWCGREEAIGGIEADLSDTIVGMHAESKAFLGIDQSLCIGRTTDALFAYARQIYGPGVQVRKWEVNERRLDRILAFTTPEGMTSQVRMITLPRVNGTNHVLGSVTLGALLLPEPTLDRLIQIQA